MKKTIQIFIAFLCIFFFILLLSCTDERPSSSNSVDNSYTKQQQLSERQKTLHKAYRWYNDEQLKLGQRVFLQNCARCHGSKAQGIVKNWQKPLANGMFPPPPLNGEAHAWHHPKDVLLKTIQEGNIAIGGSMPAFSRILNEDEQIAAIAYIQSFWSESIYQRWLQNQ